MSETREVVDRSPLTWFVPLFVVAVALAFVTARVPARARLLLLFPVALGSVIGLASGYLAKSSLVSNRRLVFCVTFGVAALAVVGSLLESHRIWAEAARAELEKGLVGNQLAAKEGAAVVAPPEAVKQRAIEEATSLSTYLVRRVTQLGRWPVAVAVAFAVEEALLAGLAAAAIAVRTLAPAVPPTESE